MAKEPGVPVQRDEQGKYIEGVGGNPRGKPYKYSPEQIAAFAKRIAEIVSIGNYLSTAARAVGLADKTFWTWYRKGQSGDKKFVEFYEEIAKAEANAEVMAVAMIRKAMADNWVAAATFLERKFPDRWGRRDSLYVENNVEVTDKSNKPAVVIHVSDEAQRLQDKLAQMPIVDAEVIEEKIHTR